MSDVALFLLFLLSIVVVFLAADHLEVSARRKHNVCNVKRLLDKDSAAIADFFVRFSPNGNTCIPTRLITKGLICVQPAGSKWKSYIDEDTAEIHDGAKYWEDMQCLATGSVAASNTNIGT